MMNYTINQLLTQGRSKGAATTILIQDNSQIYYTYGKDIGSSIINSCGCKITFAIGDENTAGYLLINIGTVEIKTTNDSSSMGIKNLHDTISQNNINQKKLLVLPSEIINLPDLHFYTKIVGLPTIKDNLEYPKKHKQIINESFIERNDLTIKTIVQNKPDESQEILLKPGTKDIIPHEKIPEKGANKKPEIFIKELI